MMKATKWMTLAAASAAMMATMGTAQAAGTLTGTLAAQLVLSAGCIVTGQNDNTVAADFGTLDFGTHPSSFTGIINTSVVKGGSGVTLTCSPNVGSFTVAINGGANSASAGTNGPGNRAMQHSNGTDAMAYDVYTTDSHSTVYVAGTAQTITIPSAGVPVDLPIFGHLDKTSANAMTAGTYTDTLAVTIVW